MGNKLNQICYNAREVGIIDDPRITFDTPTCERYEPKQLLGEAPILRVCGNCEWYSIQEEKKGE